MGFERRALSACDAMGGKDPFLVNSDQRAQRAHDGKEQRCAHNSNNDANHFFLHDTNSYQLYEK